MQNFIVHQDALVNPMSSPIKGMACLGLGGYYDDIAYLIVMKKPTQFASLLVLLVSLFCLPVVCLAEDNHPPASPEVTAALQPYLDSYKLAGLIGIATSSGKR